MNVILEAMATNDNGEHVSSGSDLDAAINEMWTLSTAQIGEIDPVAENWKAQSLPLARIKKIMKSEEGVVQEIERDRQQQAANNGGALLPMGQPTGTRFMIAGEAPVLLGKACELLIKELTVRAWRHTERNRRRTLQRQDIHAAVGESEVFDFLIDIVPRVTTSQLPQQKGFPSNINVPAQAAPVPQAMGNSDSSAMAEAEARMLHIQQMHEHMQDAYAMQMHQARLQAEAQAAAVGQSSGQVAMVSALPSYGMQATGPDVTLHQWRGNGNNGMPQ